ncbi:hypothetical protein BC827DRAFT_126815 [Russula dissimulans]|nr:hypothetical protein BC827DRAFT_126815 [Russula dissimulans]
MRKDRSCGGGQRGDECPRLYQEMDRNDARWGGRRKEREKGRGKKLGRTGKDEPPRYKERTAFTKGKVRQRSRDEGKAGKGKTQPKRGPRPTPQIAARGPSRLNAPQVSGPTLTHR